MQKKENYESRKSFKDITMDLIKELKRVIFTLTFTLIFNIVLYGQKPVYLDTNQSIEERVEDLISQMTLEEKIGQLNIPAIRLFDRNLPWLKEYLEGIDSHDAARKFAAGELVPDIGPSGGFFCVAEMNNIKGETGPKNQAELINELQKIAINKTRLKIPLLFIEEGTHGLMAPGGTVFPEGLAIGSTWNMNLVSKLYSVVAKEARSRGAHGLCTIVIEPNRDPRLGRNMEGYSEDPYLCSQIAKTIVKSVQGEYISELSSEDKAIAVLTHFPGQSEPFGGLERGAMEISERKLREVFLPPWIEGITKSGALGVMATYPAIDGEPTHRSEKLLTTILREELRFEGFVLEEGAGFYTLLYENTVETRKEAGELAIKAGVDASIYLDAAYLNLMRENVMEGKVATETIDRSVRRILRTKFLLGLFENPYVDIEKAEKESNTKESRELALQAAREGIVLLKNKNNLLPLNKNIKSIAIIGPNADDERNQLGDYVSSIITQEIVTVLDGVKSKVSPKTRVTYLKGCDVINSGYNEIRKASEIAKKADAAIIVVGENERVAKDSQGKIIGTNGEGRDVANLDLTGLQEDLIRAVYSTGTPTILVLINGRPLSIRWSAENIPAIVQAWIPGEEGGNAIADILFGDYNPDGRLPISVPRHVGQLPMFYNYSPSKAYWISRGGYVDMSASPLWEFGFGLSYTTFEYSNLQITPEEIGQAGEIFVTVDVKNTGNKEGKEVVQLYINDLISSMSTPVKELKGFEKINLIPGEKKTVQFKLTPEHLSLLDRHLEPVVEPGMFEVMVGSSSEKIHLSGKFEIK